MNEIRTCSTSQADRRASPDPAVVAETRSQRQILVAFGAIMLATLLAALDQTIVATALPEIADDLNGFNNLSLGRHGVPAHRPRSPSRCTAS